ncbi:F420-0:Gamma-glutamyl ligase [Lyngbya confervoides]|uniref:F420-0:Gamma-glutamyl ligase n=1 Tax=Lyngbya confervoides BDU141951 TaxID=1574623 RepID=A0ABD4T6P8_9CYAN|nr:F420-0:Gamma-glutamyl ligase [Lyngbya confervoides]MCM1983937.1 F420-0:Gamma-glutamyl ligase [Lyngbya confervoides BDU141951]
MIQGIIALGAGALVLLGWIGLEIPYRRHRGNTLEVPPGEWRLTRQDPDHYQLVGIQTFRNPLDDLEVMIPELKPEIQLLSKASVRGITPEITVTPQHPDEPARQDDYWFAYIVKRKKQTQIKVTLDLRGSNLEALKAIWVKLHYISYGPRGRLSKTQHAVIPLQFPDPQAMPAWKSTPKADILPIPTHLLNPLDDYVEIVQRYVVPHAQPGDIVAIGETPIAIMQGRWRHPSEIQPGWVATHLCYFFMPTSSLATACGMQALVDIVGPGRVLLAFLLGSVAKIFRIPGMFYRLAGEQARLIDDVTGTLPPFDQFIVLGPDQPDQVVDQIQTATKLGAAIVDVNDLKRVKTLAASSDVSLNILESALRDNPAGNGDEQTPVVLIRPKRPSN